MSINKSNSYLELNNKKLIYKSKEILKKLTCSVSIAALISASSVGFSTTAYAGAVNQDATVKASYADDDAVTLTAATATTTLTAATDTATSFITTATQATAWGITAGTLTVTGNVATAATGPLTITLSGTGGLTIAGAVTENNADDAAALINLGGKTLTFSTDANKSIAAKINGAGTILVTGTTKTFSDSIGASTAVTTITVSAEKTAVFSEAVTATGVVSHAGTSGLMSFAKNASAGSFSIVDGGTMSVLGTTANTITGTIDGNAANKGTLVINNSNATKPVIASAVGATNSLLTITGTEGATFSSNVSTKGLTLADTKIFDFKGNLTLGSTDAVLTTDGTLTFSGTSAQTVSGQDTGSVIKGAGANEGKISATNTSGVTFDNALGTGAALKNMTLGASAAVTLKSNTNLVNEVIFGANSSITIHRSAYTDTGTLITSATGGTELVDVPVTAKIYMPSNFKGGTTMTLFNTAAADLVDATGLTRLNLVVQDTPLVDYVVTKNALADHAVVTANNKSASTTATELGVNTNKATAFSRAVDSAVSASDNTSLDRLITVLNAQTTSDTDMANQIAPQTDVTAGSAIAAKAVTSGVQNVISTRLASLRSGDAYTTGVVTGSGMSANSGFIQAFGSQVEQKNRGNEYGYDADTTGFAIGFDGKTSDGVVVGISYANSKTDVDGKGTGRAKNDIKTNSGSIYADYATKDGYIEGSITYGKNENSTSRVLNTGGFSNTYTAKYDSEQYSLRLFGGVPNNVGSGVFVTPFAGATISQIKADAYTENSTTADDSLRLRVAQDTIDSQVGTVGLKFHKAFKDGKATYTPELKLAVNQEFGDSAITTTNTYQGGGTSFKNSTAIERTSGTVGLGFNATSDNVTFNIGYEADVREKYLGHSAQAKISAKF